MTPTNDEVQFATLIELADTTTTDLDVLSMSDRLVGACVEVLGVAAAGIMLTDRSASLRVFASSDEETRILELLELQNDDGPSLEAFRTGAPIEGVDLSQFTIRWPHFAAAAMSAGFNTAYAVPMRVRDQTIGALNLFQREVEPLSRHQVNVARVLADVAAVGIINHWSLRQQVVLAEQLQSALNTRVIIEQAKGVVAERQGISPGEAFDYLRATARSSRRPITDVASETVAGRGEPNSGTAVPDRSGSEVPVIELEQPGAPGLVGPGEQVGDHEPRRAGKVEAALELIETVYAVSPADALDMLVEITWTLNRSMLDIAIQVVADGRLPEAEILRIRRQQGNTTLGGA